MNANAHLQTLLQTKLLEAQHRNPQISMRAFARRAGLSISCISEVMNGKRVVSRKIAMRIADKLLLDPGERYELLKNFPEKKIKTAALIKGQVLDYLKLSNDQFNVISHWSHYAILSLLETKDFKKQPQWIAKRLGLSVAETKKALERLERLGFIDAKTYQRKAPRIKTSDDVLNLSLQKAHLSDLEMAKTALREAPVELRDFSSLTFPTNITKMKQAKELIRRFHQDLANLVADEEATEVYSVCTQFLPLTKTSKEGRSI